MNWCAGSSFCPCHLSSSVSEDLTGNFLGISLIIPRRCVMHFKELSHHYLLSWEAAMQEAPAAAQGRREAWRGEVAGSRSQGRRAIQRFLAFQSLNFRAGSGVLWQKGHRALSSLPGFAAINGLMWGQVPQNCIKSSSLAQVWTRRLKRNSPWLAVRQLVCCLHLCVADFRVSTGHLMNDSR